MQQEKPSFETLLNYVSDGIESNIDLISKVIANNDANNGKDKDKNKSQYKPSPAEERDNKAKEQYRKEVNALRQEFKENNLTYEQWQKLVSLKYNKLKNITIKNFSDAWDILEFCLSVKSVLNIKDNDLPFMGVILAVPSSMKTAMLDCLDRISKHTTRIILLLRR